MWELILGVINKPNDSEGFGYNLKIIFAIEVSEQEKEEKKKTKANFILWHHNDVY